MLLCVHQQYREDPELGMKARFREAVKTVFNIAIVLLIILSTCGNAYVSLAILTYKRLKVRSNFFILSLVTSDLLSAWTVMTPALANNITKGRWLFSDSFCKIWLSFEIMFTTTSNLSICLITLDRFLCISVPMLYREWLSWRRVYMLIASVWLTAAVLTLSEEFTGMYVEEETSSTSASTSTSVPERSNRSSIEAPVENNDPDKAPEGKSLSLCFLQFSFRHAISYAIVAFYVPVVLLISCYTYIYKVTRRHLNQMRSCSIRADISTRRDWKCTVTLGIIIGAFIICWTPFFITLPVVLTECEECVSKVLFSIVVWLGSFNSCLNPFIYTVLNKNFGRAFWTVMFAGSSIRRHHKRAVHATKDDQPVSATTSFDSRRESEISV